MDTRGSVLAISTPDGDNWFKDWFERATLEGRPGYSAHQYSSFANPHLDPSDIEDLRAECSTEDDYEQEILAKFIASRGAFFRAYEEVMTGPWDPEPVAGHQYVLGIDIAVEQDWTVIAVFDVTLGAIVWLERFNQISYLEQVPRIVEASRHWSAPILIDATNNSHVWESVSAAVTWTTVDPYVFSAISKPALMNPLARAIEQREIVLPTRQGGPKGIDGLDLGVTVAAEFGRYRREKSPSGHIKLGAPSGKHDDIPTAVALAYHLALSKVGTGLPVAGAAPDRARPTMSGMFTPARSAPGIRHRRR